MTYFVLLFTLCGHPHMLSVQTTEGTVLYSKPDIAKGIISLKDKKYKANKIELSGTIPGMCT